PRLERDAGVQPGGLPQQFRRDIQATHADVAAVQIGGRLPRATAEVPHLPAPTDFAREPAEQLPVERLVIEIAGESFRVFPRDRVVTSPDVLGRLLHHTTPRPPNWRLW